MFRTLANMIDNVKGFVVVKNMVMIKSKFILKKIDKRFMKIAFKEIRFCFNDIDFHPV